MVIDIHEAYFLSLEVTLFDVFFRPFIQVPSKMFQQILAIRYPFWTLRFHLLIRNRGMLRESKIFGRNDL